MSKHPFGRIPNLPPSAPAVAIDRMGHLIEKGHLVLTNDPAGFIFEVADVRPVLHPGLAPGQVVVQVMLTATFPVTLPAAQPSHGLVIVGESQARVRERAEQNGNGVVALSPDPPVTEDAPSGIVLTDAPDLPPQEPPPANVLEPEFGGTEGTCKACGDTGRVGIACVSCGDAEYTPALES